MVLVPTAVVSPVSMAMTAELTDGTAWKTTEAVKVSTPPNHASSILRGLTCSVAVFRCRCRKPADKDPLHPAVS